MLRFIFQLCFRENCKKSCSWSFVPNWRGFISTVNNKSTQANNNTKTKTMSRKMEGIWGKLLHSFSNSCKLERGCRDLFISWSHFNISSFWKRRIFSQSYTILQCWLLFGRPDIQNWRFKLERRCKWSGLWALFWGRGQPWRVFVSKCIRRWKGMELN